MDMTSGLRGGADLMVQVVLRLDSHEWALIEVGARAIMARLASSLSWEIWAVKPCLAAMVASCGLLGGIQKIMICRSSHVDPPTGAPAVGVGVVSMHTLSILLAS
jgi:hypothetical protein